MPSTPTLVFDFDGTIAQTLELALRAYNAIAEENGFTRIEGLDMLRGKGVREVSHMLNVPLRRIPFIMKTVRAGMRRDIAKAPVVPGMREVLRQLKADGHRLGVLSSNSAENIEAFLQQNDMAVFDFIYSGTSAFGKSKVLERVLKEVGLERESVLYVGDETRDIEACKKSRIKIIAVTWGLHREEVLAQAKPDWIATKPEDIVVCASRA